jgi:APA family basic amino acid/polyamine antiporter
MKSSSHEKNLLPQGFGFWTGWFTTLASMVGAGILTNSGPILLGVQSYPALLILWAVGGLVALAGALSLGEIASGLPRAGGEYIYIYEAFGPATAFTYGWAMVLVGFAAPTSLVAYTTANYLAPTLEHFSGPTSNLFTKLFATLLIIVFTAWHCVGQKNSSFLQTLTTIFNLLVVGGLATAILFLSHGSLSHLAERSSELPFNGGAWATGLMLVMYAYTGWNSAAYLAGETKDAARVVPRCLFWGCVTVVVLYLLVNVAYGFALSLNQVKILSPLELNRLAHVALEKAFGLKVARIISFLLSIGIVASLSAYLLLGPRLIFAMAQDNLFPAIGKKLNARNGLPVNAIILQGLLALVFLWTGTFEQIMTFTSFGLAAMSVLLVAPIFILRRRASFLPVVRVPFYPWTPAIFLVVIALMLVLGAKDNPSLAVISLGSILLGFPVYWFGVRPMVINLKITNT